TDSLSINGNYTFTNATDNKTGKALIRVPRNAAFGEIRWQALPPLNLALAMTYNGRESDSYSPGTKSWTRVDLKASYDFDNGVELYGRVDNLLNKEYEQVFGYGTPDRSYHAGIRGKF
ncbi:MAG: TonB-dependent receptor, partial [Alphaproteobacteria bacterium]|nr:TonB-dependent receptor [Alphaproteobacteria bacterium]